MMLLRPAAHLLLVGGLGLLCAYRLRRRRRFAPQASCVQLGAATRAALARHRWLPLRHVALHAALPPALLEHAFGAIVRAFSPQQVDYANTAYGKDHWQLSCFMEYEGGVATGKIDLERGALMKRAADPTLAACDAIFLRWYNDSHPYLRSKFTRRLCRLQSFVTRYRAVPSETHLPRHIDGANVDGSLILGLPSETGFGGGGVTVWDGENDAEKFEYPIGVGDACVLDARVWHQSNPVEWGERWVLVVFYRVITEPITTQGVNATGAVGTSLRDGVDVGGRQQAVRELLARRVKEAARRKTSAQATEGEGAWLGESRP